MKRKLCFQNGRQYLMLRYIYLCYFFFFNFIFYFFIFYFMYVYHYGGLGQTFSLLSPSV